MLHRLGAPITLLLAGFACGGGNLMTSPPPAEPVPVPVGGAAKPADVVAVALGDPHRTFEMIRPVDRPLMAAFGYKSLHDSHESLAEVGGAEPSEDVAQILAITKQTLDQVHTIAPGWQSKADGDFLELAAFTGLAAEITPEQADAIQQHIADGGRRIDKQVGKGGPRKAPAVTRIEEHGEQAQVYVAGEDGEDPDYAPVVRENGRWFLDVPRLIEMVLARQARAQRGPA